MMTINYKIIDMKLKNLIIVCKETGNYKKLAIVGFTLVSNIIDEIALKLGVRPRKKEKGESILEYIHMVNDIFDQNLNIQIFHEDTISTIKDVELLFMRNRGDLPYNYIRRIITTYYELRKVDVPNIYKSLSGDGYFDDTNLHLLSYGQTQKKKSTFAPFLLHKIREQERMVLHTLNKRLEQGTMEKAIFLKRMRQGISQDGTFSLQGTLKDNISYRQNYSSLVKYFFFGIALLPLCLTIVLIAEIVMYPPTLSAVSNLLLIFLSVIVVIIVLYNQMFKTR